MYTPVNGIASRFNRTAPQYASDKLVATAVYTLAGVKEIKDAADSLSNSSVKKANINYVRTELAKKFAYTNNEKLMIANDTIFYAAVFKSLKTTPKGKFLDTEDLDYHNSQIKSYLKNYNTQLIKIYSELVIEQSGKEIKSDAEEEKKLKEKELKDLQDAKAAQENTIVQLRRENDGLQIDVNALTDSVNILNQNKIDLTAETAEKDIEIGELQARTNELILKNENLETDLKESRSLVDSILKLVNGAKEDDLKAIKKLKEEIKNLTEKPKYE